ncbi:MAG: hypothetical protein LBR11_05190, partial [Deltaproteobacteria bacterium]|nr:hypothetical protein [Deltaproteobacteria bacterium]
MANDPKNPPVIDDWDSLPLDPEADDWDSVAPPVTGSGARPAPTSSAVGPVRSPLDSFDADEVATTAASAAEDLAGAGFDQVDFDQDESPSSQAGGGEARDDFDDLGEEDDFLDLSPIEVETPAPGTWLASPEEDSLDATGQPTSLPKAAPRPDDSLDAPVTPEPITPKPGSAGQGSGAANAAESLDSGAGQANLDSFDFEEVLKTAAEPATQAKASPPQAAKASDSGEADKSAPGSQDPARDDFLKSLIDSDDENVPKKVELDLDGIFSEAKKEAEQLSPEATHMPEEAPTAAPLEKKEEASTGEPRAKAQVVRVARYKLYLLISMVFVGLAGLGFGVYQIFLKSPVVVPPPPKDE